MTLPQRFLLLLLLNSPFLAAQDTLSFGGVYNLPGAEVRASYTPVSPLAQKFTVEEVYRLPGTFYDPARLVALLPGVVQTNDQANHLSVRGNSPNANLWRLNGLAIVNPNHTANAGTFYDFPTFNGGGVNAISAQMLDNSGFFASGLPVEYGYAAGGTFDLRLRPGSKARRRYQVQAGFIGFDGMAEGPIGNSGQTSYLVNARYSFTGLLADMGVDFGGEEIRFADLNAHLHHAWDGGELSAFTILGQSSNDFTAPVPEEREEENQKQLFDINYANDVQVYGVSLQQRLNAGVLSAGAAYSLTMADRDQTQQFFLATDSGFDLLLDSELSQLSANVRYQRQSGSWFDYDLGVELLDRRGDLTFESIITTIGGPTPQTVSARLDQTIITPFVGYTIAVNDRLEIRQGFRLNFFDGDIKDVALAPRLSVAYTGDRQSWNLTAGQVADVSYFARLNQRLFEGNFNEEAIKTSELTLSTSRKLGRVQFRLAAFGQYTSDEVAAAREEDFLVSANNLLEIDPSLTFTETTDTRRYGLELEAGGGRKDEGWYYRGSLTWLNAQTQQTDGSWSDDRYAVDFIGKLTLGREWAGTDRKDRERTFGLNLALIKHGGERYGTIRNYQGNYIGGFFTPPFYERGFVNDNGTYFRPDLRLYKTKVRAKTTTTLALDIQNVANLENTANVYYDVFLNRPNERFQLGLIPVLSYRITWR